MSSSSIPSSTKLELLRRGIARLQQFCTANSLIAPSVTLLKPDNWSFGPCAYYRPDSEGIRICLAKTATTSPPLRSRNWNWPGSTSDRTPYGVIAHELAHHVDYHRASSPQHRGAYYSNYSSSCYQESQEKPLTSYLPVYATNAEWFAEIYRLFITNHALLRLLRPVIYARLIRDNHIPVSLDDWQAELSPSTPPHIIINLQKKIEEAANKKAKSCNRKQSSQQLRL